MAAYRLYTVVPYLVKFVDSLTNVYVRYNRRRMKGMGGAGGGEGDVVEGEVPSSGGVSKGEDALMALCSLYDVLLSVCKVSVPPPPPLPFINHVRLILQYVSVLTVV